MSKNSFLAAALCAVFLTACSDSAAGPAGPSAGGTFPQTDSDGFTYAYCEEREEGFASGEMKLRVSDVSANGLKWKMTNNSGRNAVTGEAFELYKRGYNQWTYNALPTVTDEYSFNAAAYEIPDGDVLEGEVNWAQLYGALPAGEYRFNKIITFTMNDGRKADVNYGIEFEVK